MADAFLREFPGWAVSLRWTPAEAPSAEVLTGAALDAVDELRTIFVPLSAELGVYALAESDDEERVEPQRPFWLLRSSSAGAQRRFVPFKDTRL